MPGRVVARPRQLGDAEVEDLDPPVVRDEQVVGLQVAVDDALVVRGGEPLGDLARVVDGLARRQRAAVQAAAQRFAFEQLRDDVGRAVVDADVVDGQDVRVIELPGGARLLLEAMQPARIRRERLGDQLDRDVAPETRIARAVDLAHAAGAEPADDLVGTDRGAGRDGMRDAADHSAGRTCVSVDIAGARTWKVTSSDPMRIASPSASRTGDGDALAAAKRAVLAAEILEHRAFGGHDEPRVTAGDRRRVEPDLDVGIASDDVLAQRRGKAPAPHSSQHEGRSCGALAAPDSVVASPQNA